MRAESRGRWWIYLRERSPLPALAIIALAQSVSACYLVRPTIDAAGVALAAAGIVGLLVLMRLMDEVKDYDKDRIAHPDRPLPRGLFTPDEMRRALLVLGCALAVFGALVGALRSPVAGALYVFCVAYSFLMYREFFAPRLLGVNAFVYALTHQVIVVPMYAFAVATISPTHALSSTTLWFALTGLGASFVYEVARKLDPAAHPALRTYLALYGRGAAAAAIVAALGLLAVSAYRIDVEWIVWPVVALMLLVLPLLWVRPGAHRAIEATATLLGFVQMLAPTLRHALRAFA